MAKRNPPTIDQAQRLLRDKQLPAARTAYSRLCQQYPHDTAAWLGLGAVNAMLGELENAQQAFTRALALQPDLPQAHFNLARLAVMREQWPVAENHQRALLRLQPDNQRIYLELGVTLEKLGRLSQAEQSYRQGLTLDNNRAELHTALSRVLREQGRLADAEAPIARALQLQPDMALAHLEKGHLLRRRKHYDAALACYQRFGELAPQQRKTFLCNSGGVLAQQERYEEALTWFDRALAELPDAADVHLSRAQLLLGLGRFEEGWPEYEWRLQDPAWRQRDSFGYGALRPVWQGEPLRGKRLLVYAEQGFGDTLQFCRFLPQLADRGGQLCFHGPPGLLDLVAGLPGVEQVEQIDPGKIGQLEFDYVVPLMSLPYRLGSRLDNIPAAVPYLHADPTRQRRWRERMSGDAFRVGLVWSGGGGNVRDARRSLHVSLLAPLCEVADVAWYSLQKGPPAGQLAETDVSLQVTDLGPEIEDFSDTAAIVTNLDLVITVDTSVAHLAGALGRPTWVMLYNSPDWRWLLGREDSPWYPTLRLFRQAPGQPWSAVIKRVAAALRRRVGECRG
ncbi:hypothetical protein Tel_04895 [Candidatus Tenderia electrophaga]|jgi:tetratricopeptide (TPR) repeat protein|uniref:Cytochrome c-type biogenesis protein H TPR domain-containing protein n=1 Tax=Candidatus Tenderia electrophaga TaxID=1748243 RepID=A0A0S2TBJ6_9GAMM|nr:hypothetical protein Tel_04895 [Candidatus Tenderia electrophaga]